MCATGALHQVPVAETSCDTCPLIATACHSLLPRCICLGWRASPLQPVRSLTRTLSISPPHRRTVTLPGVQRGDKSSRRVAPELRTKCVRFSPTGRAWAAAATEGLLIYSLDDFVVFDPFDLDESVTPTEARRASAAGQHTKAVLVRSVRCGAMPAPSAP